MAGHEGGSADQRPGDGQDAERRVDRLAPLIAPVDVFQVQPERELVDGQADARAEDGGGRVKRRTVRRLRHQDDARADNDQDAEDLVVNVIATDLDVAEPGSGAAARPDQPGHAPGDEEGDQDGEEHPHHGLQRVTALADRELHPGRDLHFWREAHQGL